MSAVERGATCSDEREKELSEGFDRAYLELRKATGIGAYIISDEIADILLKLRARPKLDPDPRKTAHYEILDADYAAYKKALGEIRLIAKKDLGVRSGSVSGCGRLGIVLSGLWFVLVPTLDFLGKPAGSVVPVRGLALVCALPVSIG